MSLNIKEGQRAFVKKVEIKNNMVVGSLSTGRKGQDDNYINSFWNTRFVGKASDPATTLGEGDRIELTSAIMTKEKSAKDGKYYDNLTVFGFEVISKGQAKEGNGFSPAEEEDDLPF